MRSKQLRAPGQAQPAPPPEEAPGAYTDFRTLAKGLPDPPQVHNFLGKTNCKVISLRYFELHTITIVICLN